MQQVWRGPSIPRPVLAKARNNPPALPHPAPAPRLAPAPLALALRVQSQDSTRLVFAPLRGAGEGLCRHDDSPNGSHLGAQRRHGTCGERLSLCAATAVFTFSCLLVRDAGGHCAVPRHAAGPVLRPLLGFWEGREKLKGTASHRNHAGRMSRACPERLRREPLTGKELLAS